jgi:hypothetical protein
MGVVYNTAGIVTDGLVLALDAANPKSYPGSGTTWFDLSGKENNFTWVNSPTFNSSGIKYFLTQGNKCIGPASNSLGITNTSGYTISLFVRQITLSTNHAFKFHRSGTGSASRGIAPHLSWTDGNIYFDQGGCCNPDTRVSVASGGTSTWNMWTFRRIFNGSTRTIIKNNSILATNTTTAATLDLNSTNVELGSSDEYADNPWDAELSNFIVYNRNLSDEELKQNFNALRGRYGI